MFDINTLPVSGGVIAAALVWAGASAFVLGPMVAERSAQKIGWQADCEQRVVSDIKANAPAANEGTVLGCKDVLGALPPDYNRLMKGLGFGAACTLLDKTNEQKRRVADLKRLRLERAAAEAGSRCSCAVSHLTVSKRWEFALAAGSARIVVPSSVADIRASLLQSLASPSCAGLAKAEG